MAECAYCKTETQLYESNVPVCIRCVNEHPKTRNLKAVLLKALEEANERADDASDVFLAITGEIPSGLPHPDGTQRIHNASRELNAAREALMKAHNRLNDFLIEGNVPDDLKRSG
jgi:hypothetical protein